MNRRFRTIAALLALLAFSASFAEELWASTCADGGPMQAMEAMDMETMAAMGSTVPATAADQAVEQADQNVGSVTSSDAQTCPLTAAIGNCGATSIAALEPAVAFTTGVRVERKTAPDLTPDLLLASPLPHPPKS